MAAGHALILHGIVRKVLALAKKLDLRARPLDEEDMPVAEAIALPMPEPPDPIGEPAPTHRRSAFLRGFSLHANVYCHENDREALGRLLRYALRPPFASERISTTPTGQIAYKMKRPLPDGTKVLVLPPTQFLRRIASLIPPPRKHLVRYHGLFAPNARDRRQITSQADRSTQPQPPKHTHTATSPKTPACLPWAELLQRVFATDVRTCDRCGGHRRILGAVTDPAAIERILTHHHLPTHSRKPDPAREDRGPPTFPDIDPPTPND